MNNIDIKQARDYAELIAGSVFIPSEIRGDVQSVLHLILTGVEMGFPPAQALRAFWIAKGQDGPKITMTADAMLALLYRNKVRVTFEELTDESVSISAEREDGQKYQVKFTIEDARRSGLTHGRDGRPKESWARYPRRMLRARAVAMVFRDLGPDYGGIGIWTPEEIEDASDSGQQPSKQSQQRAKQYVVGTKEIPDQVEGGGSKPDLHTSADENEVSHVDAGSTEPDTGRTTENGKCPEVPDSLTKEAIATLRAECMTYCISKGMRKQDATQWVRVAVRRGARSESPAEVLQAASRLVDWLRDNNPNEFSAGDVGESLMPKDRAAALAESLLLPDGAGDWLRLVKVALSSNWDDVEMMFTTSDGVVHADAIMLWINKTHDRIVSGEDPSSVYQSIRKIMDYIVKVKGGLTPSEAWHWSYTRKNGGQ